MRLDDETAIYGIDNWLQKKIWFMDFRISQGFGIFQLMRISLRWVEMVDCDSEVWRKKLILCSYSMLFMTKIALLLSADNMVVLGQDIITV